MTTAFAQDRLDALEAKLDAVSTQLGFVADALSRQEERRAVWEGFRRELVPDTPEAVEQATCEIDEAGAYLRPEDRLRFFQRLMRDLPFLEAVLDQVESLSGLGADLAPLGREVLVAAMRALDELQGRGYFAFAKGGKELMDRVVATLGPDDLRAMGESLVPALPALTRLAGAVAQQLEAAPAEDKGLLRLLWQLRRPEARRGLARALGVLEALGAADGAPAKG